MGSNSPPAEATGPFSFAGLLARAHSNQPNIKLLLSKPASLRQILVILKSSFLFDNYIFIYSLLHKNNTTLTNNMKWHRVILITTRLKYFYYCTKTMQMHGFP